MKSAALPLFSSLLLALVSAGAATAQSDERENQSTTQLTRIAGAHLSWSEENRVVGLALVGVRDCNRAIEIAAGLPALDFLTVSAVFNRQFTDEGLRRLSGMTSLQGLYLTGTEFSDQGLQHVSGLENLAALRLNGNLTDAGLAHLGRLTKLRRLDLYGARIEGAGLSELPRLQALQTLILDHTDVGDDGLQHIREFTALEDLHLRRTRISDQGLRALDSASKLKILSLDRTAITGQGLRTLAPFSCYSEFDCANPPPVETPHVVGKVELEKLSLRGCEGVDAAGADALANLMGLTNVGLASLQLEGSAIAGDEMSMHLLSRAGGEVDGWKLSGAFVQFHETENWTVRMLSFTRPEKNLLGADLAALGDSPQMKNLQELSLQGAPAAGNNLLSALRDLTSLEILDLRGTSISADGLANLEGLVRLKVLDLRNTLITAEDAAPFAMKLKDNQAAAGAPQQTCILTAPVAQTSFRSIY